MNLLNFITENPDVVTLVVGAITGVLWKKGKGVKMDDLWETLLSVGRQALPGLMRSARLYDDAHVREVLSKTIWAGLTRLGVPKNDAVMKLVDEAVEHIHGELALMVMNYHLGNLQKPLESAAKKIEGMPQEVPITPAPEPVQP